MPIRTIAVIVLILGTIAHAEVIHVDDDAPDGGDGGSWRTAFNDLQDALAVAGPGDELWIAAGRYTPAQPGGLRETSFVLTDGLTLYGGFAGDEADLDERDPTVNITILSGDLDGDDDAAPLCCSPHDEPGCGDAACEATVCFWLPECCEDEWTTQCAQTANWFCDGLDCEIGVFENSYHIIRASGDAVLIDGLVIEAGYADGTVALADHGAGILQAGGSLTLVDVTILECVSTERGSAIASLDTSLTMVRCSIDLNECLSGDAAVSVEGGTVLIDDCGMTSNFGGGLRVRDGHAIVVGSSFVGNTSGYGGGIGVTGTGTADISACVFEGNEGSGIFAGWSTDARTTIDDCTFSGNFNGSWGGGVHGYGVTLTNSMFVANVCDYLGGGAAVYGAVEDCTFVGNVAPMGAALTCYGGTVSKCTMSGNDGTFATVLLWGDGPSDDLRAIVFDVRIVGNVGAGLASNVKAIAANSVITHNSPRGVVAVSKSQLNLVNCVVVDNYSDDEHPAGVWSITDIGPPNAQCILWNSIVHGNTNKAGGGEQAQLSVSHGAEITINSSIVEDWTGTYGGYGNFDADPMFVDPDGLDDIPGTLDDDYRLLPGSPAIDAGTNAAVPLGDIDFIVEGWSTTLLPFDHDGNSRFADVASTPDLGCGIAPIVDLGPFEFQGDPGEHLRGDLDGDGHVTGADLIILLAAWGRCTGCCVSDLNADGQVGVLDLLLLLAAWA